LRRSGGTFAVLIGALIGVTAALARRSEDAPVAAPAAAPEPAPLALRADDTPLAQTPTPVPASVQASSVPSSAISASPISAAPAPLAVPDAPATVEELKAIEVRCYAQDHLACRRASIAYEAGRLVPRDSDRAQNYRKVELTQLVRQCEKRKPVACVRLAELYAAGDVVAPNARKAEQLRAHARDLCARQAREGCSEIAAR
jgi:TPR repeat protein